MHKYKIIFGAALLAVVSILLQIYNIKIPMGVMDIDLVGVSWLISTFLFGLSGGAITSIVSAIGIGFFAPTGPIGASMKFLATIIMVLIVGLIGKKFGFGKKPMFVAFIACLIARPIIMTVFNYYLGIPLFFEMTTEMALAEFPPELFLVPNAILAAIDFCVAYLLVFSTRLRTRLND